MSNEFEIAREVEIDGTPDQVWDAVTAGTAGWLWPMENEPRLGGSAAFGGTVTAWDPPRHFANRVEGAHGWFNELDNRIALRDGRTFLRYVHRGVFAADWDTQYDGADKHTDFYLSTLQQYVRHFPGQRAAYVAADAPAVSAAPDAIATLLAALNTDTTATVGDSVRLPLAVAGDIRGEIDYLTADFVGGPDA